MSHRRILSKRTESRASEKGFTLIELLIVMIILSLLAALVAPKLFQKVGGAKQKAAKTQIALFGGALDQFRLDVGRYPKTEEGLDSLRKNPGLDTWDGPYLPKEIPVDPWGKVISTAVPGNMGITILSRLGLTERTVEREKMPTS